MELNGTTMGRDTYADQLKLPPPKPYACRVVIGSIPKLIILVCCQQLQLLVYTHTTPCIYMQVYAKLPL